MGVNFQSFGNPHPFLSFSLMLGDTKGASLCRKKKFPLNLHGETAIRLIGIESETNIEWIKGMTTHHFGMGMVIEVLKSKIHRAVVTGAELHYEGSLTLDQSLMEAAGLCANEKVDIYNITNGIRLTTYIIEGEASDREVIANGAAAHHIHTGDRIIIVSYAGIPYEERMNHKPTVVIMNDENQISKVNSL